MVKFHPFKALWPSPELGETSKSQHESYESDPVYEDDELGASAATADVETCSRSQDCTCFSCKSGPVAALAPDPLFVSSNGINLKVAKKLLDEGSLQLAEREGFVIYTQTMSYGHTQTGICGVVSVNDYKRGLIRRHENCIKDITPDGQPKPSIREASNVDPVMLMYRESEAVNALVLYFTQRAAPDIEYMEFTDVGDDNNAFCSKATATARCDSVCAGEDNCISSSATEGDDTCGCSSAQSEMGAASAHTHTLPHTRSCRSASACSSSSCATTSASTTTTTSPSHDQMQQPLRSPSSSPDPSQYSQHRMWFIDAPEDVKALKKAFHHNVELLYIADGHHRSADACRRAHLTPKSTYGYTLTVAYPDSHMRILPYNRCITTIGQLTTEAFIEFVSQNFDVRPLQDGEDPQPAQQHDIGMYIDNQWYMVRPNNYEAMALNADVVISPQERAELEALAAAASEKQESGVDGGNESGCAATSIVPHPPATLDPVNSLDAQLLFNYLLQPILGIACVRTDKRVYYVRGNLGTKGLESEVQAGRARVAFCLAPITTTDIMTVADAGLLLPPKTSWFDPKPLSGLITRLH